MNDTQKTRKFIRKLSYKHALSIIFLAVIFYVGAASLPSTISEFSYFLNTEETDIITVRNDLDTAYRNMLDFDGEYPVNKGAYINFNGLIARLMGQRFMNERIKLDNGHLTQLTRKQDATFAAAQLTKLCNSQKENGRDFLFVIAPFQVPKYDDIVPAGYIDYSNQNSDALLEMLRENGVPILDLREEMKNEGIDHSDAFFVTDHHWTPETGFWAYTEIINSLTLSGTIDPIDRKYTDINEYDIEIRKDWFLGSSGKRTGSYYAGVDDFSIIVPRDPDWGKEVSLEFPNSTTIIQGSFRDILFYHSKMETEPDYFIANPYGWYGLGDRAVKQYRNSGAPTELNMFVIGDSFALSTFPYLSLIASSLDDFDMRYYDDDFKEYYNENLPDVIIILVTAHGAISENTTYDFVG